ncbi:TetR/AcrR family transcriptional regulator [Streptomyces scopuliridis]|uniref:TetR family transcriptional regulator n=1 Tax=Streptomyces scopuliridis RB72 TaxID=1440053 RepID=A0A2T7TAX5_9ACTN|nr:TetR/AcrR family transcriptional regulator [Streptomyces scopuliridis]PVE12320.1 TetR family transcriptional regulator [Streptomyces scopuliridis RB72]WSB32189.1 TetR/AcrR family transcriptional regulator [Streptomyces scopuliridis]
MSTRTRILEAAADLVAKSPNGDISTRAVCEAAQVGAPVLYRQFGDKEGLLSAVVDHGFDAYLATKRLHQPGADPIQDLRDGWDTHVAFALANPNLYRLMNSPLMRKPPASALEAHQILTRDLERAAAQGKLRISPELAAQMVMSANVGVALMLVGRPATFKDPDMSRRVRDAAHAAVFTPEAMYGETAAQDATTASADGPAPADTPAAAARLGALVRQSPPKALTTAETTLLSEWLERVSNAPDTTGAPPSSDLEPTPTRDAT